MKLLVKSEKIIDDRHKWKHASESFAHMNGVSHLAWCINCNIEAVTGSVDCKCIYHKNEYVESYDGEDICVVSTAQQELVVTKIKKHMLRILRTANVDIDFRQFQGVTQYSYRAYKELIEEGKIVVQKIKRPISDSYYMDEIVKLKAKLK